MSREQTFQCIAHIRTDFPEKFGIPRQSNLVPETVGRIVFEKEFRDPLMIKGIEGFSYLWLLWRFDSAGRWSKTVRPPRLGGKETVGVFASRSPYRPNPIGLSSVRLLGLEETEEGTVLLVSGADLRDGTAIFDIKPYIAYADSHQEAEEGFAGATDWKGLMVDFPEELLLRFPEEKRAAVKKLLSLDPRPRYGDAPGSVYGVAFAGKDVRFTVEGEILTVTDVTEYGESKVKGAQEKTVENN